MKNVVVAKKETTTPTCKDSLQVGDMAKMREALEAARDLLLPQCNGGTAFAKACGETVNKIMDALSAPARKDVVRKDCSTDCVLYNKCSGRVKCAECGKELCDTDRDEHGYCSICAEEYAAARVAERNGAK